MVRQLLEAGADPNIPDNNGDTPLLTTRHLFDRQAFSTVHGVIRVLIYEYPTVSGNVQNKKVNVNATNLSRRTILSFAVQHGDRAADVSRLLLNSGASVWPENDLIFSEYRSKYSQKSTQILSRGDSNCSQASSGVKEESSESAFKWYLRSLMRGTTSIKDSKQTLYMLCTAMESQQHNASMGQHIDKTMMELGVAPKINGPLFKQLRTEIMPFITKPQSLRFICIKSIRKSIGRRQRQQMIPRVVPPAATRLKRLRTSSSASSLPSSSPPQSSSYSLRSRRISLQTSTTAAVKPTISMGTTISNCKLKLPHKLQQFVCLEEMVVPN